MTDRYLEMGADISPDGRYRYLLWREWRGTHDRKNWHWYGKKDGAGKELGQPKACVFIMLNPSTADGETDDPTIRRCVAFAKAWHFERLEVVNLFAYRATSPRVLLAVGHQDDPVGCDNQRRVEQAAADAGKIVCAWGAHGTHLGQDQTMLGWLLSRPAFALGFTQDGQPRHPLYAPASAMLVPMPP